MALSPPETVGFMSFCITRLQLAVDVVGGVDDLESVVLARELQLSCTCLRLGVMHAVRIQVVPSVRRSEFIAMRRKKRRA